VAVGVVKERPNLVRHFLVGVIRELTFFAYLKLVQLAGKSIQQWLVQQAGKSKQQELVQQAGKSIQQQLVQQAGKSIRSAAAIMEKTSVAHGYSWE
jgi:hypothetical protein